MHSGSSQSWSTPSRDGTPKVVRQCSLPTTGRGVVERINTDLAVIDLTPRRPRLIELTPDSSLHEVPAATGTPLLLLDGATW